MQKIFQYFDKIIDATPMYRVVSSMLLFLAFCSITMGALGIIPYSAVAQSISLVVFVSVALIVNWVVGQLTKIPVHAESAAITALIIFFLVFPAELAHLTDLWVGVVVIVLALLSKFVLVWKRQHILNPAAAGVVGLALAYALFPIPGYFESGWWIGQRELFLPLLLAGVVVVIKIKRWVPVLAFLVVSFSVFLIEEWRFGGDLLVGAERFWLSGPSLFLAFFMLTEPFTMPPTRRLQFWYGVFVGAISQTTLLAPFIKVTPELALLFGNIAFYSSTLGQKLLLPFLRTREVAKNTVEFIFEKPKGMHFIAGQYLEWMLPHAKPDSRGTRRYFTIASAPSEEVLKIGVRFGEELSSYKTHLAELKSGSVIIASQLAGDFVLPKDHEQKIALVAGGIGITPFISQLTEAKIKNEQRDIVLFSCNNTLAESAYRAELLEIATVIPLRVVEVLAKETGTGYESGYLTAPMIKRQVADYLEREWYISGPSGMVDAYVSLLQSLAVRKRQIHKDFFPGLA